MEGTLVLEQCNNPLFTWLQHWINAHKFGLLGFPLHHPLLMQLHVREEGLVAVFHHIWSLMTIHVNPFCYVLGPMQGAFFIFHLLTKPFPSRDQPPIHLDHMTNHLTSHLTTHMTSHMPFQSPAPKSPAHHLILPHLTSHDPIPTPDSSLFAYLSLASGFSARLLYFPHSLVLRLILTPFLVTFTRESVPQYMTPFLEL